MKLGLVIHGLIDNVECLERIVRDLDDGSAVISANIAYGKTQLESLNTSDAFSLAEVIREMESAKSVVDALNRLSTSLRAAWEHEAHRLVNDLHRLERSLGKTEET